LAIAIMGATCTEAAPIITAKQNVDADTVFLATQTITPGLERFDGERALVHDPTAHSTTAANISRLLNAGTSHD
jgi:hypothetical protein